MFISKNIKIYQKNTCLGRSSSPLHKTDKQRETVHQSPHTREVTTVHHSPKDSWVFCPQSINQTICLRSTGRRSCGFEILHKNSKNGQKNVSSFTPHKRGYKHVSSESTVFPMQLEVFVCNSPLLLLHNNSKVELCKQCGNFAIASLHETLKCSMRILHVEASVAEACITGSVLA